MLPDCLTHNTIHIWMITAGLVVPLATFSLSIPTSTHWETGGKDKHA